MRWRFLTVSPHQEWWAPSIYIGPAVHERRLSSWHLWQDPYQRALCDRRIPKNWLIDLFIAILDYYCVKAARRNEEPRNSWYFQGAESTRQTGGLEWYFSPTFRTDGFCVHVRIGNIGITNLVPRHRANQPALGKSGVRTKLRKFEENVGNRINSSAVASSEN